MTPDVSVIIPHLNQNDALDLCLASLAGQTYPLNKIEVIIIDNGSDKMPAPTHDTFKNLLILREPTPGPGPARNTGVQASNSRLLFFIDADCTAHPDWIKRGASILTSGQAKIIGGDVKIPICDHRAITALEAYETIFAYTQEIYIKKTGYSGSGNLATSRKVFDAVGPFTGIDVAEDQAWGAQAIKAGFSFTYCPEMIIYHPARETYAEIFKKWDRHSRHVYAGYRDKSWPLLRWAWRSFLVLGSIPAHTVKVIFSKRISGIMPKIKAVKALAIIRLFRVGFMLHMVFSKNFRNKDISWNR